ncbi:Uncharacterized protein TPAR_06939 [Tolypocladium paradoxum]|uniref:SET domain-containing protein n=1 Tax=Tolypocladium paradoxum TaxID=94208 RepID=A0A2S4KRP5_9HYPO|nr:Uncharacterized protein TPAR_06939 [Tolypocladium paradoxum]
MSLSLTADALLHPFSYPNGHVYDVSVDFTRVAAPVAADKRMKEPSLCTEHVTSSIESDTDTTGAATDDPPINDEDRLLLEFIAKIQQQLSQPLPEDLATEMSAAPLWSLGSQPISSYDDRPSTNSVSSIDSEQPPSKPLPGISIGSEDKTEDQHSKDGGELRASHQEDGNETCLPPVIYKTCPAPQFDNEYFEVAESKVAGWGAFATKPLKRGNTILREKPLFVADHSCLFQEYDKLDKQAKRVALSLYANELFKSVGGRLAGLFPIAARFNHSCHPTQNVDFEYDEASRCLVLYVRADEIAAGEELKISYGKDRTLAELYMTYGFRCRCGGCPGMSDKDFSRLTSRW